MKTLSLILAAALALSGCATPSGQTDPKAFIGPAAAVAAYSVIAKGKTQSDKVAKAEKLNRIADGLMLLSAGEVSGADIAAVVLANTNGEDHWVLLSIALEQYFVNGVNAGVLKSDVVSSIATGIKVVAARYLPSQSE